MLPHPLHKRILSRVIFYSGVVVIAFLMRLVTPDPSAEDSMSDFDEHDSAETEVARAYFVWPNSQ